MVNGEKQILINYFYLTNHKGILFFICPGYVGFTESKGSFIILCNNISFQLSDILISVSYQFKSGTFPMNGSLQFEYVKPRQLITHPSRSLYIKSNFSYCDVSIVSTSSILQLKNMKKKNPHECPSDLFMVKSNADKT